MKVLICDHADCMMPDHALEIETLRAGLGEDGEGEVLEYVMNSTSMWPMPTRC